MSDQRPFAVRLEPSSLETAVWASGRLDIESAQQLLAVIVEATRRHPRVVLELSGVDSMDAAALGALVAARQQAGDDASIILRRPNPLVARLLRLTDMDDAFEIED